MLENIWSYRIASIIVLSAADDTQRTHVYTFFPYSPHHECEHVVPALLAVYSPHLGFAPGVTLFPDKYANLHRCPLRIATYRFPPMIMFPTSDRTNTAGHYTHVDGIDGHVLHSLAERLNYSSHIIDVGIRGLAIGPNNSTGCFGMVLAGQANMTIGHLAYSMPRLRLLRATNPLYVIRLVVAVPPGVPYTPLQKLLQPFQPALWTLLACIAGVAACTLMLLDHCAASRWRSLFLGGDRGPLLTAVAIGLGASVQMVPRRNLARFMFVSWTVLLFVVRNTYQAYLCYFLQSEHLIPRPSTLAGLVDGNYTIHLESTSLSMMHNISQLRGINFEVLSTVELFREISVLPTMTGNIGLVLGSSIVSYYNLQNVFKYAVPTAMIPEQMMLLPIVVYMPRNSGLKLAFDTHIERVISAGLMDYWFEQFAPRTVRSTDREGTTEPRKLLLEQLLGTFVLCAVLLAIACATFGLELLLHRVQLKKYTFLNISKIIQKLFR